MSTIIDSIEKAQLRRVPRFDAGDRVRVHFQVTEGTRTRTQVFEGVVLKRQGSGARETFTVRKQSFGVGVERTFPVHSPKIERLEIAARGDVRRAKLYYLRDRVGKAARVAERRWGITDDLLDTEDVGAIDAEGDVQDKVAPEDVVDQAPADEGEEDGGEGTQPAEGDAAASTDEVASSDESSDASSEDAATAEDPTASADEAADSTEAAAKEAPGEGDGDSEANEQDG